MGLGIPRNMSIAAPHCPVMAFIDDDEEMHPG
jgi:hypothetical protein